MLLKPHQPCMAPRMQQQPIMTAPSSQQMKSPPIMSQHRDSDASFPCLRGLLVFAEARQATDAHISGADEAFGIGIDAAARWPFGEDGAHRAAAGRGKHQFVICWWIDYQKVRDLLLGVDDISCGDWHASCPH